MDEHDFQLSSQKAGRHEWACLLTTIALVPVTYGLAISSASPDINPYSVGIYGMALMVVAVPAGFVNALVIGPVVMHVSGHRRLPAFALATLLLAAFIALMFYLPMSVAGWAIIWMYLLIFIAPAVYAGLLAFIALRSENSHR